MALHRISIFLARHSQKLALVASATGIGVAYAIQPYYEIFARWSLIKTHEGKEVRPSERVRHITDTVYEYFDLTDQQKAKLDVFLIGLDQPVPIGSVLSDYGYAFVGLPFFVNYSNPLEVPTEEGQFYTRYFPHGPYSPIGKQLLDLAVVPEPAVRFMIARELVRLGAKPKNNSEPIRSTRFKSLVTVSGMIGGLYAAYQMSYLLNRYLSLPVRWSLPARLLCYTSLATVGLFCQWQGALAWRRSLSFRVDRIVAQMDPSLLQAGLAYYDWRLRYNRFCYDRAVDRQLAKAKARSKTDSTPEFDPIQAYQDEQLALQREQEQQSQELQLQKNQQSVSVSVDTLSSVQGSVDAVRDQDTGYYLPRIDGAVQPSSTELTRPDASSLRVSAYVIHPRLTVRGNERWAADGDALAFGFTELLSLGYVWSILARLFSLFFSPATSEARLIQLKTLSGLEQKQS